MVRWHNLGSESWMAESTAGCMVRGWRWREVLWEKLWRFVRYMIFQLYTQYKYMGEGEY